MNPHFLVGVLRTLLNDKGLSSNAENYLEAVRRLVGTEQIVTREGAELGCAEPGVSAHLRERLVELESENVKAGELLGRLNDDLEATMARVAELAARLEAAVPSLETLIPQPEDKLKASLSWEVKPWPEEELDRLAGLLKQAPPQNPGQGGHFARYNFLAQAMGCHVREIGAGLKLLEARGANPPTQAAHSAGRYATTLVPLADSHPSIGPVEAITPDEQTQKVIARAALLKGSTGGAEDLSPEQLAQAMRLWERRYPRHSPQDPPLAIRTVAGLYWADCVAKARELVVA